MQISEYLSYDGLGAGLVAPADAYLMARCSNRNALAQAAAGQSIKSIVCARKPTAKEQKRKRR